jgi:hypothetical protein
VANLPPGFGLVTQTIYVSCVAGVGGRQEWLHLCHAVMVWVLPSLWRSHWFGVFNAKSQRRRDAKRIKSEQL